MQIKETVRNVFKGHEEIASYSTSPIETSNSEIIKVGLKKEFEEVEYDNASEYAENLGLPKKIDEIKVVYHFEGKITLDSTTYYDPMIGGISIGHENLSGAGTLGGVVWDSDDNKYLLSNTHVIAPQDQSPAQGDSILQPGPGDGGTLPDDLAGSLEQWVWETENCDAAIASVDDSRTVDSTNFYGMTDSVEPKEPWAQSDLYLGQNVEKSGRTTGHTTGEITDAKKDINLDSGETFEDVIEVGPGEFTDNGDSGSRVWASEDMAPIGINFAGSTNHSFLIPAPRIESQLNVSFQGTAGSDAEPTTEGYTQEDTVLKVSNGNLFVGKNRNFYGPVYEGFKAGNRVDFAKMNDKIFMVDGDGPMKMYDPESENVTTVNTERPKDSPYAQLDGIEGASKPRVDVRAQDKKVEWIYQEGTADHIEDYTYEWRTVTDYEGESWNDSQVEVRAEHNSEEIQWDTPESDGWETVASFYSLEGYDYIGGDYKYIVTYVKENSESLPCEKPSNEVSTEATDVLLTNIPTSPDDEVIARNIYRTTGTGETYLLLRPPGQDYTIEDNTTTEFTDMFPDSRLGRLVDWQTGKPPEGLSYIEEYNNILFASGNEEYPRRVYFSNPSDPAKWYSLDFLTIDAGVGEITGFETEHDRLYVFKEQLMGAVVGQNRDSLQYSTVATQMGIPHTECVASLNGYVAFLTTDKRVMAFNGEQPRDIGRPVEYTTDNIQLDTATAFYDQHQRFNLSFVAEDNEKETLIYYVDRQCWGSTPEYQIDTVAYRPDKPPIAGFYDNDQVFEIYKEGTNIQGDIIYLHDKKDSGFLMDVSENRICAQHFVCESTDSARYANVNIKRPENIDKGKVKAYLYESVANQTEEKIYECENEIDIENLSYDRYEWIQFELPEMHNFYEGEEYAFVLEIVPEETNNLEYEANVPDPTIESNEIIYWYETSDDSGIKKYNFKSGEEKYYSISEVDIKPVTYESYILETVPDKITYDGENIILFFKELQSWFIANLYDGGWSLKKDVSVDQIEFDRIEVTKDSNVGPENLIELSEEIQSEKEKLGEYISVNYTVEEVIRTGSGNNFETDDKLFEAINKIGKVLQGITKYWFVHYAGHPDELIIKGTNIPSEDLEEKKIKVLDLCLDLIYWAGNITATKEDVEEHIKELKDIKNNFIEVHESLNYIVDEYEKTGEEERYYLLNTIDSIEKLINNEINQLEKSLENFDGVGLSIIDRHGVTNIHGESDIDSRFFRLTNNLRGELVLGGADSFPRKSRFIGSGGEPIWPKNSIDWELIDSNEMSLLYETGLGINTVTERALYDITDEGWYKGAVYGDNADYHAKTILKIDKNGNKPFYMAQLGVDGGTVVRWNRPTGFQLNEKCSVLGGTPGIEGEYQDKALRVLLPKMPDHVMRGGKYDELYNNALSAGFDETSAEAEATTKLENLLDRQKDEIQKMLDADIVFYSTKDTGIDEPNVSVYNWCIYNGEDESEIDENDLQLNFVGDWTPDDWDTIREYDSIKSGVYNNEKFVAMLDKSEKTLRVTPHYHPLVKCINAKEHPLKEKLTTCFSCDCKFHDDRGPKEIDLEIEGDIKDFSYSGGTWYFFNDQNKIYTFSHLELHTGFTEDMSDISGIDYQGFMYKYQEFMAEGGKLSVLFSKLFMSAYITAIIMVVGILYAIFESENICDNLPEWEKVFKPIPDKLIDNEETCEISSAKVEVADFDEEWQCLGYDKFYQNFFEQNKRGTVRDVSIDEIEGHELITDMAYNDSYLITMNRESGIVIIRDNGTLEIQNTWETPSADPSGIDIGPDGNVWYLDGSLGNIWKIDIETGDILEPPENIPLNNADGLAVTEVKNEEIEIWSFENAPGEYIQDISYEFYSISELDNLLLDVYTLIHDKPFLAKLKKTGDMEPKEGTRKKTRYNREISEKAETTRDEIEEIKPSEYNPLGQDYYVKDTGLLKNNVGTDEDDNITNRTDISGKGDLLYILKNVKNEIDNEPIKSIISGYKIDNVGRITSSPYFSFDPGFPDVSCITGIVPKMNGITEDVNSINRYSRGQYNLSGTKIDSQYNTEQEFYSFESSNDIDVVKGTNISLIDLTTDSSQSNLIYDTDAGYIFIKQDGERKVFPRIVWQRKNKDLVSAINAEIYDSQDFSTKDSAIEYGSFSYGEGNNWFYHIGDGYNLNQDTIYKYSDITDDLLNDYEEIFNSGALYGCTQTGFVKKDIVYGMGPQRDKGEFKLLGFDDTNTLVESDSLVRRYDYLSTRFYQFLEETDVSSGPGKTNYKFTGGQYLLDMEFSDSDTLTHDTLTWAGRVPIRYDRKKYEQKDYVEIFTIKDGFFLFIDNNDESIYIHDQNEGLGYYGLVYYSDVDKSHCLEIDISDMMQEEYVEIVYKKNADDREAYLNGELVDKKFDGTTWGPFWGYGTTFGRLERFSTWFYDVDFEKINAFFNINAEMEKYGETEYTDLVGKPKVLFTGMDYMYVGFTKIDGMNDEVLGKFDSEIPNHQSISHMTYNRYTDEVAAITSFGHVYICDVSDGISIKEKKIIPGISPAAFIKVFFDYNNEVMAQYDISKSIESFYSKGEKTNRYENIVPWFDKNNPGALFAQGKKTLVKGVDGDSGDDIVTEINLDNGEKNKEITLEDYSSSLLVSGVEPEQSGNGYKYSDEGISFNV